MISLALSIGVLTLFVAVNAYLTKQLSSELLRFAQEVVRLKRILADHGMYE